MERSYKHLLKILTISVLFSQAPPLKAADQLDECFIDAGNRYDIDPNLLKAIAHIESRLDPSASNSVGDKGLMQINPFWFDKLQHYGITEKLLENPCINANVGAWILAQSFSSYGRNWEAVGRYHAGVKNDETTLRRVKRYATDVENAYLQLTKK